MPRFKITQTRRASAAIFFGMGLAILTASLPAIVQAQATPGAPEPSTQAARQEQFRQRDQLWNESRKLRGAGKLAEAVATGEQMLAIERTLYDMPTEDLAFLLQWLGETEQQREEFAQAEKRFREALDVRAAIFGADHWKAADARLWVEDVNRLASLSPHDRQELRDADEVMAAVGRLYGAGKYAEAIRLGAQCVAVRARLLGETHPSFATDLNNLAVLYTIVGDYARAASLNKQALEIRKKILGVTHPDYAQSLINLAGLYDRMGDYARAEPLYKQAMEIWKKALGEAHPSYAASLYNLGALYKGMGDYARAEPLYQQALEIRKKALGEMHPDYAASLNGLATLYDSMGDYVRAEPLYQQALEIRKKALGEAHPDHATSLNNLAGLYRSMGDYVRAEPLYQQALEINKKALGEAHPDYSRSLNNLAALYHRMGDNARAEPLYKQAMEIDKKVLGETHAEYATSLNNLAFLYISAGDYARAEPLFKQALEINEKALGEAHPNYAVGLNNLAFLHDYMGDYVRAEPLYKQALEINKKALGEAHPEYAASLGNLGMSQLALGHAADAQRLLRQAVQIQRQSLDLTAAVQSEQQQLAMAGQERGYLDGYLTGALAADMAPAEIYAEVAAWKGSVSAQQQLLRARQRARAQDPNSELGQFFTQLEQQTRRLSSLTRYTPRPEEQAKIQQALQASSESVATLQQKLSRLDPDFHRAWAERKISPEQLSDKLPEGVALVDLLAYRHCILPVEKGKKPTWERRLVAFVLSRGRQVECIELGKSEAIAELVDQWRAGYGGHSYRDQKSPGAELRRLVWEPLESRLADAKVVLISPDGALTRIPWAALPGAKPDSYLLEERAIAVVPVAQRLPEMLAEAPPSDGEHSLLLLGDVDFGAAPGSSEPGLARAAVMRGARIVWPPLPGTKTEIDKVQELFSQRFSGAHPTLLEQGKATESALRQNVQRRYVHLATHGFFSPPDRRRAAVTSDRKALVQLGDDKPAGVPPSMLAGIVLAGANRPLDVNADDGILTAFEVAELPLEGAELITLSACETGLGESAGGEGLLGLQRAFQIAGARTVISGLWKVPDRATQMLMVRFYENLWQKKMGKLAALREAQIWMLRQVPKDPQLLSEASRGATLVSGPVSSGVQALPPHFWAAFVLSGDWR